MEPDRRVWARFVSRILELVSELKNESSEMDMERVLRARDVFNDPSVR